MKNKYIGIETMLVCVLRSWGWVNSVYVTLMLYFVTDYNNHAMWSDTIDREAPYSMLTSDMAGKFCGCSACTIKEEVIMPFNCPAV